MCSFVQVIYISIYTVFFSEKQNKMSCAYLIPKHCHRQSGQSLASPSVDGIIVVVSIFIVIDLSSSDASWIPRSKLGQGLF